MDRDSLGRQLFEQRRHLGFASTSRTAARILRTAVAGDEGSHSVLERPRMQHVLAEEDMERLLAGVAASAAQVHERTAGIFLAVVHAAAGDDEIAEAYRALVGRMQADASAIATLLVERRGHRQAQRSPRGRRSAGLPDDDLAATVWMLGHPDGYQRLVIVAGWSVERYRGWLEQMLRTAVLGPGD